MANFKIGFLERFRAKSEWGEIQKSTLSHKHIRRYPKKSGKDWNYVYNDSWKHHFRALLECFGLKKTKVDDDYSKNNINKDFGVTKETFAAHVLEYFTNKLKWDNLFSKKSTRDKYKKPEMQKEVVARFKATEKTPKAGSKKTSGTKSKSGDKMIVNRSLMRKVWGIYSVQGQRVEAEESEAEKHSNRSNAMKGNKNAEKNSVYIDNEGENNNGENNTSLRPDGLSAGNKNLRTGRGEGAGSKNVVNPRGEGNGSESLLSTDEPRGRPGNADGDVDRGRGRITKGQARKIREQCREILKKPDSEITNADKEILSQYVGAGGTDEEGSSNSGVLYEFYTPRNVISKVWELVDKYNPRQDKSVIEPSSGIGRFAEGRSEKFTMFELEKESARIAHILHPDAEVVQGAFQENFLKNKKGRFTQKDFKKFDCAVGNPPYGAYTGKYKGMGEGKEFKRYETYFMSKTLDTLEDGGIMAMVVPSGFMDGKSQYGKDLEKITGKAELLEAWRLPNGTFESTDIGTDIVVFKKGKSSTVENLTNYFKNNPDHIAGEVSTRIGRFGEETYIKPKDGEDFASAVSKINVGKVEIEKQIQKTANKLAVVEDKTKAGPVTSKTVFGDVVKTKNGTGIVVGYVKKNRKTVGVVVNVDGKTEDVLFTDEQQEKRNRSEAMKGNKNAEGNHDYPINPNAHIMDAAEFNKKYGKIIDPKDLPIWKVTDKFGNVKMSQLSDEQKEYVKKSDHFIKEGEVYTNAVNYASGNVREKLKNLDKNDPQYEVKKSLLEAVCPKEKKIGEFTLSPITDWAAEYKTKDGVSLINGFFAWAGYGGSADSPIAREEIPPEINWQDIRQFIFKQPYRATKRDLGIDDDDKKGFEHAKQRNKQLRRDTAIKLFNRYLQEGLSLEDQKDLTEAWNLKSNSFVNPDFNKIPVFVDGMSTHKGKKEFNLLEQQLKGISMLVNKGTGLLAYDVGVGKTACGIVATVNQIQTGRAKRPVIAVPKSVYSNWIKSIHQLFPEIKVNELGNLSKNYWKEGMKIEDGSISVCTYEGLENIGFNESEEAEIHDDVEFATFDNSENEKDSKRKKAQKKEKLEETVGAMSNTRNEGVQFSDLGFDHITVDEVHNFRNLFKMPKHMNKKGREGTEGESNEFDGLGSGGEPSNRAKKLFAITQLIQRHNDGRNTFLLSATPFQNSPTEIYSILSYMARDKLKEMGYYSLEQFVSNFCKVSREYVVKANRVTEAPVVKGFENLGELQGLLQGYMDKVDGEQAGVVRPYKRMHSPELELTDLQKAIMDECSAYIEKQESMSKKQRDDGYMFRAMNAMKNCALSPALVDTQFIPDGYDIPSMSEFVESSPKLKFTCDSIIEQYKKNPHNGQIMYMPSGVEQFPQVKNYLIKHGLPKDAIATVAGAATTDKALDDRDKIFSDFNNVDGKCKVIIGSSTIKEGCNLQGNTTTIYCTQLDWNPTDVQQLWGRGWRQGNKQGIVHCITPLMHDSLDPMIYQKHDEKSSRTTDLYSYKGDTMNAQDVNPEELKFALIKDPVKRADLQVMEFTEKNKSDQKMYGQLIDVLHKQIDVAYKSDEDIEKEVLNTMWRFDGVEKTQEQIDSNLAGAKEWEKKRKDLEKKWKGKEEEFTANTLGEYSYIVEGDRWTGYKKQGAAGLKSALESIDKFIADYENRAAESRKLLKDYNKAMKKEKDLRESTNKYLQSKGLRSREDCEDKIKDYLKLMDTARNNVEKAKDIREQFYVEAVAYNEANKKNLLSVDELVKMNVDSIMNDLHPMDDEWKAKIKTENDKRFGRDVSKSWCYFDKNGNLYFRKSAFTKYV